MEIQRFLTYCTRTDRQTDTEKLTGHLYDFVAGTPKKNKFNGEFRTTFKANGGESGPSLQHVDTLKYAKGID
jgi:hypothetical protein